jgi:hypothetical protein
MDNEDDDDPPVPSDDETIPPDDEDQSTEDSTLSDALRAFSEEQRLLASFDSSAFAAAAQAALADLPALKALQESVAKSIAQSINFPLLQEVAKSIQQLAPVVDTAALHTKWADALARSIDLPSMARANELILSSTALRDAVQHQQDVVASITRQFDSAALRDQFRSLFESVDWEAFRARIDRWLPDNLRDADDLNVIADICLEEGIPLAWVPRATIVRELVQAKTVEERRRLLEQHFEEILDDCETVLVGLNHEWANQCRVALIAVRRPETEPAGQSHAAGIIDSIVLAIHGGKRESRAIARTRAEQPFDDLPLIVATENLVLRPLLLGFAKFWLHKGDPVPGSFARHATAHAVGQAGVFSRLNALVAVMLATSLTMQFWDDPSAPPAMSS